MTKNIQKENWRMIFIYTMRASWCILVIFQCIHYNFIDIPWCFMLPSEVKWTHWEELFKVDVYCTSYGPMWDMGIWEHYITSNRASDYTSWAIFLLFWGTSFMYDLGVSCRRLLQQRPGVSGGHPEHPQTQTADRLPHANGPGKGECSWLTELISYHRRLFSMRSICRFVVNLHLWFRHCYMTHKDG